MSGFNWRIYRPVTTKSVSYTFINADSNTTFDNTGDVTGPPGTVFNLPLTSTVNLGTFFTVLNQTTGGLQFNASGTDIIRIGGVDSSAGGSATTGTSLGVDIQKGATMTIGVSSPGVWNVTAVGGVFFTT